MVHCGYYWLAADYSFLTTPVARSNIESSLRVQSATAFAHQLGQQQRSIQHSSVSSGYAYARKQSDAPHVHHEHNLGFQQVQLTDYLIKTCPKWITMAVQGPAQSNFLYQEPTIYTTPEHLLPLMYFLRDHVNLQFKTMIDITAVDFPERKARFEVIHSRHPC